MKHIRIIIIIKWMHNVRLMLMNLFDKWCHRIWLRSVLLKSTYIYNKMQAELFSSVLLDWKLANAKNFDLLISWHQSPEVNTSHSNRTENKQTNSYPHARNRPFNQFVHVNLMRCKSNYVFIIEKECFRKIFTIHMHIHKWKMHQLFHLKCL